MPCDIRAETDLMIAMPSRSGGPLFVLAMRAQCLMQLFEFVQEDQSSKLLDIWRRSIRNAAPLSFPMRLSAHGRLEADGFLFPG